MPDERDVGHEPIIIAFREGQQTPEIVSGDDRAAAEALAALEGLTSIDPRIEAFKGVCDFCLMEAGDALWIYPCDSFTMIQTQYTSVADWAACDDCAVLIEADDMEALVARRAASPEPHVEELLAEVGAEDRERVRRSQLLYFRAIFEAFMVHRWGERRRYDPFEGYDMPEAIRTLPRDEWGLPIPFAQLRVDGRPDFRSLDQALVKQCVESRLCGLCGRVLDYWIAFIGGPACRQNRLFKDPAMHPDCAAYAARACPFIAGSKTKYSSRPLPEGPGLATHVDRNMAAHERRPADMFIFHTRRYKVVRRYGEEYIEASPWASVERIASLR
ncbi:MAG: hypothetical protein AB7P40_28960 [Chloroflexota bacterium]